VEQIKLTAHAGKEISLSLGGYGSWASNAQSFLDVIKLAADSEQFSDKHPRKALAQISFESTLIYVDIPITDLPMARSGTKSIQPRSEVWHVLHWLRKTRGVEGIYELNVRDSCYLPHNERIIRECLRNFDIEVLDWRRLDLSIRVLFEQDEEASPVCRNLRKLRLYAGGWPALAYWTSKEGLAQLCRLQYLRSIEIFIIREFVGGELSASYEDEAYDRIEDFVKEHPTSELQVTISTNNWATLNPQVEVLRVKQEHTATESTSLAPFLEAYDNLHRDFERSSWRENALDRDFDEERGYTPYIKVAVIDNGVDPGSIDCRGVTGASFVPSETGESNWWYVKHPHGTSMARIISEINPHCRLLVAKVGDKRTDFTATRLKKAIEWAVSAGADVISMSLSLANTDPELEIAINKAFNEGIVILASINGEGANAESPAFPASLGNVIAIGSADNQGSPSRGTVEEQADFLLPGEQINAHVEFLNGLAATSAISGPSVATAIASGLASLVLACDRFALHSQVEDEAKWTQHRRLRHHVVKTIFVRMTQSPKKSVQPGRVFVDDKNRSAWGESDSVLSWIDEIMRDVLK
jgi:hypothetical protein